MKRPKAPGDAAAGKAANGLSGDEHALWRYVAQSIAPIRAKPRVRAPGEPGEALEGEGPARRPAQAKATPPQRNAPAHPVAATAQRPTPPLADFDPRKARKIAGGKAGLDARIDLHGLRQSEAHGRLRAFLADAHARGCKTVLVITGKGREDEDRSTAYVDTLDRSPRGVLRRNLPRWLAEPELRAIVVSYTQAAVRHGGEGAFYVELRRGR
jgi:DNA-nicking Smr family endonuclease